MTYLFWAALFLLAHTYFFYPVSLALLGWAFGRERPKILNSSRKVSILIAAFNEEQIIEEKIKNCLELEFPRENLEILIGSDGSTDNTEKILAAHERAGNIKFIPGKERAGKAAVLNRLIPHATGDFILFCDANTMLLKNSLQKLLSNFTDDSIGCVCGRLILQDSSGSSLGRGESIYWTLESEIKKLEGRLGIVLGSNGGIYAIRKKLFRPIPENKMVMDDFFITTQVLREGYKAVYEPLAIGSEETSLDQFGEFKRKIRIGQANFNMISEYLVLMNPVRGLVAYSFFSHKLLRWIGPMLMILLLLSNSTIILSTASFSYSIFFLLQCLFYLFAAIGYSSTRNREKPLLIMTVPFYFLSMNIALFMGMLKSLLHQEAGGAWERVERTK